MSQSAHSPPPRVDRMENHRFTYRYEQPAEYRFCQDSVIFPHWLASHIDRAKIDASWRALDLCAGCGVIGFELAYYLPEIANLDFLEIQNVFCAPFEENLRITGSETKNFRFLEMSYDRLSAPEFKATYDLIVANPPYFHTRDGKLSPSEVNNRCRFFIDSGLEPLIRATLNALKPEGEAYLLVKPGFTHGRDQIAEVRRIVAQTTPDTSAEPVVDIRGTWVMCLKARSPR